MGIALGTLLALIAVAVIAYPFLGAKKYRLVSKRFLKRENIRAERLRVYRKISDLEADYTGGDVTEADFQSQRDQLRIIAANLLREEAGPNGQINERDEQLEQEISRMRERSPGTSHTPRSSEGEDQS